MVDLDQDTVKAMIYELCDTTSDQFRMKDHEVEIIDMAEKHIRNGGRRFNEPEIETIVSIYSKYIKRKANL